MKRRSFLKHTGLGALALQTGSLSFPQTTHIFTLSFDDGFKDSFYRVADLYEAHGLRACLNVIASGHLKRFKAVDDWILPELMGSFEDWNALKARGHEVMPHSWKHLNLANQAPQKAKRFIDKCLDYFANHLDGYAHEDAVFNFPFNASTPELVSYLLTKVRAVRTRGTGAVNPIPQSRVPMRLQCLSQGPDNIDRWVESQVQSFLASPGGWMILNVHGLDNEGWGPMSTAYLESLLKRLVEVETLEILPAGEVLKLGG